MVKVRYGKTVLVQIYKLDLCIARIAPSSAYKKIFNGLLLAILVIQRRHRISDARESMINGFTRQETINLTGISSGRLSYLDRTGLVIPLKLGNPKHPKVVYSWQQVLDIKTIERLREKLPLQEIRKVLEILKEYDYEPRFFVHSLVLLNSQLYLIKDLKEFGMTVLEISGKSKGQVVIHEVGQIGDIISDLTREAEKHHVLDFEKRANISSLAD